MFKWIHRFGSPPFVYRWAGILAPWFGGLALLCAMAGLWYGLVEAPADYEQGEVYRIIYIHVPAAWLSMFLYLVMAICSGIYLIWRLKIADLVAEACAPLGASFTFLALLTGSIWGKPTWGTWWTFDARLTSELILLFLYLGYIALRYSIEQRQAAMRAASILALVGVVNLPIIHYSVEWWNTLHQPATITKMGTPSIHISMLIPLLLMTVSFQFLSAYIVLQRVQSLLLHREPRAGWVAELVAAEKL